MSGPPIGEQNGQVLFVPRSERYAGELLALPGTFAMPAMFNLALGLTVFPIAWSRQSHEPAGAVLNCLLGAVLLGPSLVHLVRRRRLNAVS